MKHILTTALTAALCVFSAAAQTVVITSTDGTVTKFPTDRVKEITFENVGQPDPGTIVFNTVSASAYSGGLQELVFEQDNKKLVLNIYGPTTAAFLNEGEYTLSDTGAPFTIDPAAGWSYYVEDGVSETFSTATLTVSRVGLVYTLVMDVTTASGKNIKAQYTGEIPALAPVKDVTLDNLVVVDNNDRVPGEFYVRMNDAAWHYTIAFDFFAASTETRLPAGDYTFSATPGAGNYGPKSYVERSLPYINSVPNGTVNVSYSGENIIIAGSVTLTDGMMLNIRYEGPIEFLPPVVSEYATIERIEIESKGSYQADVNFYGPDGKPLVYTDVFYPSGSEYLPDGTYQFNEANDDFTCETYHNWGGYSASGDKEEDNVDITSGTMTVTRADREYTVILDLLLANGETYKAKYVGEIRGMYPGEVLLPDASTCSYGYLNDAVPGEYLLKLSDPGSKYEMSLDLFCGADATSVPAGTYTFSTSGDPMTLGSRGYVSTYFSPYDTLRYAEGSTVTVSYDGDVATIIMDFKFENGKVSNLKYVGTISGTPGGIIKK